MRQKDIRIFFDIFRALPTNATQQTENYRNEHTQIYLATHVTVAHGKAINHIDLCVFGEHQVGTIRVSFFHVYLLIILRCLDSRPTCNTLGSCYFTFFLASRLSGLRNVAGVEKQKQRNGKL